MKLILIDVMTLSRYKRINLTEAQANRLNSILFENRESKNLSKARNYIRSINPNADAQRIVDSIRTDIPNSRIADCKFVMGVARMFLNNELTDQSVIAKLNKTLRLVGSNAHVNEYDNNLNGEDAASLIQRFSGNVQQDLDNNRNALSQQTFQENGEYTIVPIDSFEAAEPYGKYTSWCVTHDEDMYSNYTHGGLGRFYFCLRNGFENVEEVQGENCPLDEYGLSMIAVSVNEDGSCNTVTCRWNHDNGGNDNIMNEEKLSKLIGRNFYDVFKAYTNEELAQRKQDMVDKVWEIMSNNGDYLAEYFTEIRFYNEDYDEDDSVYYDEDMATKPGLYIVKGEDVFDIEDIIGDKVMVFNADYEPIIRDIFDDVEDLSSAEAYNFSDEVFLRVRNGKKYNLLRGDGKLILNIPLDKWPIRIQSIPSASNRFIVSWENGTKQIVRGTDGFMSEPFVEYSKLYNTSGFFKFQGSNEIKYMDIEGGKVFLDNIEMIESMSELAFIKFFGNEGYLLYMIKPYRIRKVSNIQFKRGGGWYGSHYYRIITADGREYDVDYIDGKTYDMDTNLVDQVNESRIDLIVKNILKEIKDSFEFLRK